MKKPKRGTKMPEHSNSKWTTTSVEGADSGGPYTPDSSDLQRRIKANPLGIATEAKFKLHKLQGGYRRDLYAVLAMVVGIARHYYNEYKDWKPFFAQPFFQTGKHVLKARKHQADALRHTMNYVFDAKSKQARSRTGKYAAALHNVMITGVPVDRVAAEIEREGGIERLYEAYLERTAHAPKKGARQIMNEADHAFLEQHCDLGRKKGREPEDMTLGDLEDDPLAANDGGQRDSEDPVESDEDFDIFDDADRGLEPTVERGSDPAGRPIIGFEMNSDRHARFLELGYRSAVVHIEGRGTENGWQRIRVKKVIWQRR